MTVEDRQGGDPVREAGWRALRGYHMAHFDNMMSGESHDHPVEHCKAEPFVSIRTALAAATQALSEDRLLREALERIESDAGWLHDHVPDYTPDGVATLRDIAREIAKTANEARAAADSRPAEPLTDEELEILPRLRLAVDRFDAFHAADVRALLDIIDRLDRRLRAAADSRPAEPDVERLARAMAKEQGDFVGKASRWTYRAEHVAAIYRSTEADQAETPR